jgi:hypothetical protein
MYNYDNLILDHEKEFIEDLKIGRFVLAIGSKGSGKSYLLTSYMKKALQEGTYKNVHFVCPVSIKGEASNSYSFLENQKHVLIYPHYTEAVSKRVDADRKKEKTLFVIDDASGELLKNIDNTLIQLITTTRHYKGLTIWICVHSAKRILLPVIRQNLDHIFIYKIINMNLLRDLYDEYFSMMINPFDEFKNFYLEATQEKNSCIHFSLHQDGIDIDVKNWNMNHDKDKITLKPTQNTHKKKKEEEKPKTGGLQIKFCRYKRRY